MTTVVSATAATLLVPTLMLAASAQELVSPEPTETASASPVTIEPTDESTASVDFNPNFGEFEEDPLSELPSPTVEITAAEISGETFNGTIHVNALAAIGAVDRIQVQVSGSLLLEDGETFPIVTWPLEMDNIAISGEEDIKLTASLADFFAQWEAPGVTVHGIPVVSMSPVFQLRIYVSYLHPEFGQTGMPPIGPLNLTRG
jgi:hypothetical protein